MHGIISALKACHQAFPNESIQFTGGHEALRSLLAAGLLLDQKSESSNISNLVVICDHQKNVDSIANQLEHLVSDQGLSILRWSCYGLWGHDRYTNSAHVALERAACLRTLVSGASPRIIVTSMESLAQKTMAKASFKGSLLELKIEQIIEQDELAERLSYLGYTSVTTVTEIGSFCLRGGICDVYPVGCSHPLRIEFIGDAILSLRTFDAQTQRSNESLTSIVLTAAGECLFIKEKQREIGQKIYDQMIDCDVAKHERDGILRSFYDSFRFSNYLMFKPFYCPQETLLSYLGCENSALVVLGDEQNHLSAYEQLLASWHVSYDSDHVAQRPIISPSEHFQTVHELSVSFYNYWRLSFSLDASRGKTIGQPLSLPVLRFHKPIVEESPRYWLDQVNSITNNHHDFSYVIGARGAAELAQLERLFTTSSIAFTVCSSVLARFLQSGVGGRERIIIGFGDYSQSFLDEQSQTFFLRSRDFLPKFVRRSVSSRQDLDRLIDTFAQLSIGDFVVHSDHGIGRYRGIKHLGAGGVALDYVEVEYAQENKLYVPADRISCLHRYVGEQSSCSMDRLGSQSWDNKQNRVRKKVKDIAQDLLSMQAKRAIEKTYQYQEPARDYQDFVDAFPYIETSDQLRAIDEIEADMKNRRSMDRLLVGDVGYGKTEVAMRAAMRAVLSGYQVIVLAPTTVLTYQHGRTFSQRMNSYGVEVAVINRMVGQTGRSAILERYSRGQIDILIGTHALFGKSVKAKNLGLVIIDEEQKFGVVHKEQLKKLRSNVDILTLSATPIPRTLHMAVAGLRDISLIATPPKNRRPVMTVVLPFSSEIIQEAVAFELARGGQIFFVHNRVADIDEIARTVQELVPSVSVKIGHGQMPERQLEQIILDFIEGKFHVLVCTTIIESGIDMPNVNTLIINHAESFGLSQLYQLRGRVGRSATQAYAYFLTGKKMLPQATAEKRLEAITAHQELGAGFKIASIDLEIRGAGNLLGSNQSGHATLVGLDRYSEMLAEEVKRASGEEVQVKVDPEIKLFISAYLPESYVPSESRRLSIYRQLFQVVNVEDINQIMTDLVDVFGQLPQPVQLLGLIAELKILLRRLNAKALLKCPDGTVEIRFAGINEATIDRLVSMAISDPDVYFLSPDYRMMIRPDPSRATRTSQDWLELIAARIAVLIMD